MPESSGDGEEKKSQGKLLMHRRDRKKQKKVIHLGRWVTLTELFEKVGCSKMLKLDIMYM